MLVDLPEPIAAAIGETFFPALIKLEPDGRLRLLVPMGEIALDADAAAIGSGRSTSMVRLPPAGGG